MARSVSALALLVAVALLGALSAPAGAAPYVAHACQPIARIPSGTAGWQFVRGGRAGGSFIRDVDACYRGGGFTARLPGHGRATRQDFASWVFRAPEGTTLTRLALARQIRVAPGPGSAFTYTLRAGGPSGPVLETCRGAACAALPGGRTFALPPATRSVSLRVSCAPAPARRCARTGTPVAAGVTVTSADVTLEDSAAPGPPAQLTGRVFVQGASGRSSVELQALDEGSGVASLEVRVDGQTTATYPVTSCARFAASRYLTPHPCPNMRRFELPLPTGGLSNGAHTVQVRVHDAVGNVGVSLPRLASVFNPGQPGAFARVRGVLVSGPQQGERLTVRYASPLTITGQLQDAQGRPLPALTVEAGSTGDSRRGRTTSDAQGRFSLPFPAARSGVVSLVAMSGTRAIGVQELALHVRPSIILHAVAARARNGQSIGFEGLILPAPAQPLVATLQALDGKRWTNVGATITILATGHFATRFKFRHTTRRTRFAFRVHLPQQGAYPFEADSSRVVRVLVRP